MPRAEACGRIKAPRARRARPRSENKWFQTGPRPLCIGLILNELKERFLWGFTDNAFSGSTTHLTVPFWLSLPPQYLRKSMRQGPPLTDYLPF